MIGEGVERDCQEGARGDRRGESQRQERRDCQERRQGRIKTII